MYGCRQDCDDSGAVSDQDVRVGAGSHLCTSHRHLHHHHFQLLHEEVDVSSQDDGLVCALNRSIVPLVTDVSNTTVPHSFCSEDAKLGLPLFIFLLKFFLFIANFQVVNKVMTRMLNILSFRFYLLMRLALKHVCSLC